MEISSSSSQPSTHIAKKAIDEVIIIKQAEKEEIKNNINKSNIDFKKYNFIEEEIEQEEKSKKEVEILSQKKSENIESSEYEIELRSDSSSDKKTVNNHQNTEQININLNEENNKQVEEKEQIEEKSIKNIASHYCPFNFFEKEKCKNINFKQVNIREFVSALSSLWKKMSDKEKEPYVKLSENYKKNLIDNYSKDNVEVKFLNKKRKKRTPRISKSEKDENRPMNEQKIKNNEKEVKEGIKGDFSTTVYTTNKYYKKKGIENNIFITKNKENKDDISISVSNLKEKENSIEVKESENKNVINEENKEKNEEEDIKNIKISDNTLDRFNNYLHSILIPFVVKSFNFIENISNKKISE